MEAAVLPAPKPASKRTFTIQVDGWEIHDPRPVMTEEEFEDFCLHNPNLRIEQDKHGNVKMLPPSTFEAGDWESEVAGSLGIWNRSSNLGKTFSSSTIFFLPDGEKRMPDAAWISMEKHARLSRQERRQFARIAPDFVVEVRSPSDSVKDLKEKITGIWMANGVRLAWLIDVEGETSWIFRADGSSQEVQGLDKTLSGENVLQGFVFDLSVLKD